MTSEYGSYFHTILNVIYSGKLSHINENKFRECYVRTSCEDFDLEQDNLDKVYVHLTNNAIQKTSDNYGKFEDGN